MHATACCVYVHVCMHVYLSLHSNQSLMSVDMMLHCIPDATSAPYDDYQPPSYPTRAHTRGKVICCVVIVVIFMVA